MKKLLYLLAIPLFFACSSPMDVKYSRETAKEDMMAIKESKVLDSTEMSLLAVEMVKGAFGGGDLEGKTYAEILEGAKAKHAEKEEKRRKKEEEEAAALKAEQERVAKLNETLSVSLTEKGFEEADYEDYLTYKFAFNNRSSKNIKAFKGTVIFRDLFGGEITKMNMTYDDGVTANSVTDYSATTDYNQFRDSDKELRYKDMDQIEVVWVPETILFEDGTSLE